MYTIDKDGHNEIFIKNSKFITFLKKINTIEEVPSYLAVIKKQYPKATHYCYAYRIGLEIKKSSDDKEPAGTAGIPMLTVLEKEDITNVLVITVRYFGGIKLGAGGLIRAYSNSVKSALKKVSICELIPAIEGDITFSYSQEKEVLRMIPEKSICKKDYLDFITYRVIVPLDSILLKNFHLYNVKNAYIEKVIK